MNKKNILSYNYEDLEKDLLELGFKKFNAKQIFEWLHKKIVRKFDDMTNISLVQRDLLKETFYIPFLELKEQLTHGNKETYIFELEDLSKITAVAENKDDKVILHIASQTSTPKACSLLEVSNESYRNLDVSEILNQVYTLHRRLKNRNLEINNVNFSTEGEPLFNFDNLLNAVEILTNENLFGLSKRKITVTTCGVIEPIDKLMQMKLPLELHIKLHAITEDKRSTLLSINKSYTLEDLHTTLSAYQKSNKRRITFEYVLIKDFNCTQEDLEILGNFIHDFDHNLVLKPFKSIEGFDYEAPHVKKIERIFNYFKNERNVNVFLEN